MPRPFNFGTSVPRTEALADVESCPTLDLEADGNADDGQTDGAAELKNLLDELEVSEIDTHDISGAKFRDDPLVNWTTVPGDDWCTSEVLLTRAERRRLVGGQSEKPDGASSGNIGNELCESSESKHCGEDLMLDIPTRPHKRRKLASSTSHPFPLDDTRVSGDPEGASEDHLSSPALSSPIRRRPGPAHYFSKNPTVSPAADVQQRPFFNIDSVTTAKRHSGLSGAENWINDGTKYPGPSVDQLHMLSNTHGSRETAEDPTGSLKYSLPAQVPPSQLHAPMDTDTPVPSSHSRDSAALASPRRSLPEVHRSEKATAQKALFNFISIRGKALRQPDVQSSSQPKWGLEKLMQMPASPPRSVPAELTDANTLSLPEDWISPSLRHRYLASLDLVQKNILIKHLTSEDCNVDPVERNVSAMNGVDIIIDVDTALLFVALASLPVKYDALAEKIVELSWDFTHLFVVFQAFSDSLLYRANKSEAGVGLAPYPFSPAVVKAIKKLKRTVKISEATETGNKRRDANVRYAYARDVREAARITRMIGDISEHLAGALQDEREWLMEIFNQVRTILVAQDSAS